MYLSKSLIWKNFVGVHDSLRIKHLQTRICKFKRIFFLYFLACLICFIRKTAESDFEKWIKFLFLNPRPCSAEMLPLDLKFCSHQKEKKYGRNVQQMIFERCPTCDYWSTHRGRAQCRPSPPGCTGESWCSGACCRPPRVHNQPPGLHPSLPSAPGFEDILCFHNYQPTLMTVTES